jgi:hypothetical protein
MTVSRNSDRVLNVGPGPPEDGKDRRRDLCPKCGNKRWELLVVPDRFFCDECQVASLGPNEDVAGPEPEQIDLFGVTTEGAKEEAIDDGPPLDEGMAWVSEEMPDE